MHFLQLCSAHNPLYESWEFSNELSFLRLAFSKSHIRSLEYNGIVERFHRTLNKQSF